MENEFIESFVEMQPVKLQILEASFVLLFSRPA